MMVYVVVFNLNNFLLHSKYFCLIVFNASVPLLNFSSIVWCFTSSLLMVEFTSESVCKGFGSISLIYTSVYILINSFEQVRLLSSFWDFPVISLALDSPMDELVSRLWVMGGGWVVFLVLLCQFTYLLNCACFDFVFSQVYRGDLLFFVLFSVVST